MDKQIKQILSEIYDIDPRLEDNERELIKIIKKLLASRPDTKFDKAFARKLRAELLAKEGKTFDMSLFQKFGFLIGGAALASLLIVPVVFNNAVKDGSLVTDVGIDTGFKITMLDEEAFGSLGDVAAGIGANAVHEAADAISSYADIRSQSGGGGGFATLTAAPEVGTSFPAPEPYVITQYNYVYAGEDISLDEDKLEVLRRKVSPANVGGLASQFGLGLVNLQNIGNLQFENVSLTQGTQDGLRVYVNLENGELSLNKEQGFIALEEAYRPLQLSDVPSDEALIKIANDFVKKYQVNLSGYGDPEISDSFRHAIELAASNTAIYIPDIVSVVYPLSIEGTRVYDQGANPQGVYVNINVRTNEVISLHGLSTQQYDASLYSIESDINTLIEKWQGQNRYEYPQDLEIETVDVNLGTPELVYMELYRWDDFRGESRLLVPAYRFPVLEKPAQAPYYPDYVVTPLVISLLGNNGGPVRIMEGQTISSPPSLPPETAASSGSAESEPGIMVDDIEIIEE